MNSHRIIVTASLGYSLAVLLGSLLPMSASLGVEEPRTEIVTFRDLNINTATGVKVLYTRIHAAALRVCHQSDSVAAAAVPACVLRAELGAIQRIDAPALTAYYQTRTGHRV